MAFSTAEAHENVRRIDRTGQIADLSGGKIQKAAKKRDFALPIATRASKILGPISRHLMAQIIPMLRNAHKSLALGWLLAYFRVL